MHILTSSNEQLTTIRRDDGTIIMSLHKGITDLDGANLDHADLRGIQAEGLVCMEASFREANLDGADLYWIIAAGAIFDAANLQRTIMRGGNLTDASFIAANLTNADLSEDNVGGATDLRGANLETAELMGTNFRGARYDQRTAFPKGFDPRDHSMKLFGEV